MVTFDCSKVVYPSLTRPGLPSWYPRFVRGGRFIVSRSQEISSLNYQPGSPKQSYLYGETHNIHVHVYTYACLYTCSRKSQILREPSECLIRHTYPNQAICYFLCRPSEVECVSGLPHFLATPPPSREPFYHSDREVVSPKIRSGEGGGTLVYSNHPTKHKYVSS